jgi:hypothetical protein
MERFTLLVRGTVLQSAAKNGASDLVVKRRYEHE